MSWVALAAVAVSTGAMAQATISGLLNIGAINNGKTTVQATGANGAVTSTKTSSTATHNAFATSVLNITATEDLGGGLRATAVMISGVSDGFAARERTLALSGGFGTVRMGRFVPTAVIGYHGYSGASSANLAGSIYGLSQGGTTAAPNPITQWDVADVNMERNDSNIQYTSPAFNGFTVNVNYRKTSSDASQTAGKISGTQTGFGITYVAGPLSVGAGMNELKGTAEAAAGSLTANGKGKSDLDWIGASYNFGVATVFATHAKRKDVGTTAAGVSTTAGDVKLNAFGVSVPMGAITLRASTYSGKDKQGTGATDDMKLSGHQVAITYAFSKRTTAYAAMGENKIARDGSASTFATRKVTGTSIGLTHSF